jgi:hypothetical protein
MDWFSFMVGALVVGSWPFWFFLAALCSALMYEVEHEKSLAATGTLILGVVVLFFASDINFTWLFQNVYTTLILVVAYFGIGAVWGIFKWHLFTAKLRKEYDKERNRFLSYHNIRSSEMPPQLRDKWIKFTEGKHVQDYNRYKDGSLLPDYTQHKEKITLWMTYWPWSLMWFLLNDPVTRAFSAITTMLQSTIDSISRRNFAGTENDLVPSPPPPSEPGRGHDQLDRDLDRDEDKPFEPKRRSFS